MRLQMPFPKAKGFFHYRSFTLIELIMTMVVMGVVAVPLSLLLSQHTQSVFQSADYTTALNLARLEMEKVNNTAYASINSASYTNYSGYDYDLTRTFIYAYGTAMSAQSVKKILVSVTKHGSATELFSLVTYIAKNVNFGL
jgi:prepilin-type N-terminal cleavage/methylation domain-containing protein